MTLEGGKKEAMWISEGSLVFYHQVPNDHKFSSLKQYPLIIPQFLWVWALLSWVLWVTGYFQGVSQAAFPSGVWDIVNIMRRLQL